jgi:ethanolamine ammonia-lyase small subunit
MKDHPAWRSITGIGIHSASESMSAYMCYRPRFGKTDSDRNVISNIHRGGIPPLEAGAVIADFIHQFLIQFLINKMSGVNLKVL